MSEYSVVGRQVPYEDEGPMQTHYPESTVGGISAQDLAQQILVGMQSSIEAQVDWRIKQQGATKRTGIAGNEIPVILGSIGIGIPLMGIAAQTAGLAGLIVICVMLVMVNAVWARR